MDKLGLLAALDEVLHSEAGWEEPGRQSPDGQHLKAGVDKGLRSSFCSSA